MTSPLTLRAARPAVWPGDVGYVYIPTASGGTTSGCSSGYLEVYHYGVDGSGKPGLAQETLKRLDEMSRVVGTDWALGIAARSTALCVDDARAEDLYLEAIDRLGRSRMAVDLARAHLLYGEWLRRQRRRVDARRELRVSYDLFSDFGMPERRDSF